LRHGSTEIEGDTDEFVICAKFRFKPKDKEVAMEFANGRAKPLKVGSRPQTAGAVSNKH